MVQHLASNSMLGELNRYSSEIRAVTPYDKYGAPIRTNTYGLLESRTKYPAFYDKAPLSSIVVPFGTAAADELGTAAAATISTDTAVLWNGRPTSRCTLTTTSTGTLVDAGISTAAITLDANGQALLSRYFLVAIKLDPANTISTVSLYVGDATYTNFYTFSLTEVGRVGDFILFQKGGFGATTTTGAPNLANPIRTKIRVTTTANVNIGSFWFGTSYVLPQATPSVVFTCDDGFDEWDWLSKEAAKRGVPISFGIVGGFTGGSGRLTERQVVGIGNHRSGLFEITNHSNSHTDYGVLPIDAYIDDVNACRDYIISLGLDPDAARCHQYPHGVFDQALIDRLKIEGYLTAREVGSSVRSNNTVICLEGPASDRMYKLPASAQLTDIKTLTTVKSEITSAALDGTAFIMGHRFEAVAAAETWIAGYDATYGVLNLLDWLAEQRDTNGWHLLKWSDWVKKVRTGTVLDSISFD